ncbi:LOW QUALITY PROTEIN: uncharacterized protein AB9W97_017706 [Spinachia spinachia]
MEESFADLLSDAFSEKDVPWFPDEDLDFENFNFEENFKEDKRDIAQDNLLTGEDRAVQQEATGQTAVLSNMETKNVNIAKKDNEKSEDGDFEGAEFISRDKTLQEDYTSSDGEIEEVDSEDDEEDNMGPGGQPGDLLRWLSCSEEFRDGDQEDMFCIKGQTLPPEGAGNPPVRIEEGDEEVSHFEKVPKRGNEMMIRSEGIKKDAQDREKEDGPCDYEQEGMRIGQEEADLALCGEHKLESPGGDGTAKDTSVFPEISVQNLLDLTAEVDSETFRENIYIFSGEEHQEAGESFADYPSDFSSCEYVEDGARNQDRKHQSEALACASGSSIVQQSTFLEGSVTDGMQTGRAQDSDEERYRNLHSRNLEREANEFSSVDVANGEKGMVENMSANTSVPGLVDGSATRGSESYTSSDDEEEEMSDEEFFIMCLQDVKSKKHLEETRGCSTASFSDYHDRVDPADFNIHLNPDMLTTEDKDEADTPLSDGTLLKVATYSVVQEVDAKTTQSSKQGSLNDNFVFNTEPEASGTTETEQLGDDESEDERNWQQEQQRIKSFYEFYNDSDGENERGGRLIKVQFSADPLSQVIHYETDSSDRASLSSSIDGKEDLSSAETSECFNMLTPTLKIGLAILTGLLMFWFATDIVGCFDHVLFF